VSTPSRHASRRLAVAAAVLLAIALPLSVAVLVTHVFSGNGPQESPRTFYVNEDGDDASDGRSRDQAWHTLDRVSREQLRPGDRVLVNGKVTGTLSIGPGEAGDPHNPVVIASYGSTRAAIVSDIGIEVRNTAGVAIRDIGIYGSGSGNERDGISIYADAGIQQRLSGITLENLDVSGFVNGISIGAEGPAGFADVQITDSVVRDNRNNGLAVYGPKIDTNHPSYAHRHVVITAVYAYNNSGNRKDEGANTGSGIVVGSVDTALIDQSAAYGNGTQARNFREGPIGIWAYDSSHVTIQRSLSYSNRTLGADGDGFGLDQNTTDSVIQYNLSYDNSGAGILLFGQQTNRPNTRNTVRYNISVNDSRIGYHGAISLLGGVDKGDYNGRVSDAKIYQNTLVVADNNPPTPALLFLGSVDATTVANNVLSGPLAVANRQPAGNILMRENDYFSIGDHLIEWGNSTYASVDDWRRAIGSEEANGSSAGIQADPQLVNPATPTSVIRATQLRSATGFSPGPTSPLPGAGVDLASVGIADPGSRDFLGAPVTEGRPGIGAIVKQRPG
jgi:Right handed beta helix region